MMAYCILHDILDLIKEFKRNPLKEENIKVKLKGFKEAYDLENCA
jgi:purine nucleoside phosphorylase